MARQENLFNCPMCGRPAEVPSRYAGKVFVHSICGSTLRMVVSHASEVDLELVSKPEVKENFTVNLESISKSDDGGLFLPRHLRNRQQGEEGIGGSIPGDCPFTESPGETSASLAKALARPVEATASRLREVRLNRDRSKSSRLRARFSKTVDDLPSVNHHSAESNRADLLARDTAQQAVEKKVPLSGQQQPDVNSPERMKRGWKLIVVGFAIMAIVAVIFMLLRFLPID